MSNLMTTSKLKATAYIRHKIRTSAPRMATLKTSRFLHSLGSTPNPIKYTTLNTLTRLIYIGITRPKLLQNFCKNKGLEQTTSDHNNALLWIFTLATLFAPKFRTEKYHSLHSTRVSSFIRYFHSWSLENLTLGPSVASKSASDSNL